MIDARLAWTTDAQLAWTTVAIDDRCTACGACIATCPERALLPARKKPDVVDSLCTACGACIEVCPRGAVNEVIT
jgi:electron transport complex protein RnfB